MERVFEREKVSEYRKLKCDEHAMKNNMQFYSCQALTFQYIFAISLPPESTEFTGSFNLRLQIFS